MNTKRCIFRYMLKSASVAFSGLTRLGDRKGIQPVQKTVPLIVKRSVLEL